MGFEHQISEGTQFGAYIWQQKIVFKISNLHNNYIRVPEISVVRNGGKIRLFYHVNFYFATIK